MVATRVCMTVSCSVALVLFENTDYHDLGGDYHAKRDPQRALRRITRDANRLGYTVHFDPIQAA